jgi:hypothetical protein
VVCQRHGIRKRGAARLCAMTSRAQRVGELKLGRAASNSSRSRRALAPRPGKRAPGARSLRARPVVSRRPSPRSSPSPLNYTDPSGYGAEENEAAAIGIGVGYFGGLAATLLTSGGGVGAAVGGTSVATAAGGGSAAAGAGVAGAVPALAAASVGAGIASSIGVTAYLTVNRTINLALRLPSPCPAYRSLT